MSWFATGRDHYTQFAQVKSTDRIAMHMHAQEHANPYLSLYLITRYSSIKRDSIEDKTPQQHPEHKRSLATLL